ncbi:hypothetical protein Syun_024731 [Stephania yunnanensis]|uniref:Putative gamma-glutamylcyclotransferase n=1 Tax=Stephania yunnanensis TaxID=152371 RepID=A0AAP0EQB2_9MAGN
MADEVVRLLLKRVPLSSPATLPNFHRFRIKGRIYPAIKPLENNNVTGRVLLDITDPELEVLDIFEDVEYERRLVDVTLIDNVISISTPFPHCEKYNWKFLPCLSLQDRYEKLDAYAYVWVDKNDPNLYGDWDFEEWRRTHMNDFLNMTVGFVEELEGPDSKTRVATYESFFNNGDKPPMS